MCIYVWQLCYQTRCNAKLLTYHLHGCACYTVNSEIFARVSFSRNFAYAKFRENKILAIWRNHPVVYCYRWKMLYSRISNVAHMYFSAIRENKILAKNFRICSILGRPHISVRISRYWKGLNKVNSAIHGITHAKQFHLTKWSNERNVAYLIFSSSLFHVCCRPYSRFIMLPFKILYIMEPPKTYFGKQWGTSWNVAFNHCLHRLFMLKYTYIITWYFRPVTF